MLDQLRTVVCARARHIAGCRGRVYVTRNINYNQSLRWFSVSYLQSLIWPWSSSPGRTTVMSWNSHSSTPHWFISFIFLNWPWGERETDTDRQTDRQTLTCCSTYLSIHWLLVVCTFTRDGTHNPGLAGWLYNQSSYSVRASLAPSICSFHLLISSWLQTVTPSFSTDPERAVLNC